MARPRKKSVEPYPQPKKGQRVKCLACKDGQVYDGRNYWTCKACNGKGFITA
jgi:DnaJ-class molecular chaperone